MARTCFIGAPHCGQVGVRGSAFGMMGRGERFTAEYQYFARYHVHKVYVVACPAEDALVGVRLLRRLEPMVNAQARFRTSVDDSVHANKLVRRSGRLLTQRKSAYPGRPLRNFP
jgi:hypothetical protein